MVDVYLYLVTVFCVVGCYLVLICLFGFVLRVVFVGLGLVDFSWVLLYFTGLFLVAWGLGFAGFLLFVVGIDVGFGLLV